MEDLKFYQSQIQFSDSRKDPKISIIISFGGNDPLRNRNFKHCIDSIDLQNFKDFEVIVVEQSLDGNLYKQWVTERGYKWVGIKDPMERGFNLSWCRNVGAKKARGEKIILLDSDICFGSEYLDKVNETDYPFCGGASNYHWIRDENATRMFEEGRNFNWVYNYKNHTKRSILRFSPFSGENGFGAVLVFNREWFLNVFGGYPEDFFLYGWEDKAAVEIIKKLLCINDNMLLPFVNYEVIHLSHGDKNYENLKKNEILYNRIKDISVDEWIDMVNSLEFGSTVSPNIIIKK
jgi:glycosyltransferase involved in cell wall biosynthesis